MELILALYHSFINKLLLRRFRVSFGMSCKLYQTMNTLCIRVCNKCFHIREEILISMVLQVLDLWKWNWKYINISATSSLPKIKLKRGCQWKIFAPSFAANKLNSEVKVLTANILQVNVQISAYRC